jgi:DNA-binding CsgD family transcriptional regulator
MRKKRKVQKWSASELALLKKLYPHCKCTRDVAKQLGRPLTAVRQKAYDLGIKTEKYRPWSADELELLRELYTVKSLKDLAEQLGRSPGAVGRQAYVMGLLKESRYRVWSNEENKLLKKMFPKNTLRVIADKLGRSCSSVEKRSHKLGLRKSPSYFRYPRWSAKEIELLKKLYPHRNSQEVADKIGRSVNTVRVRACKLELKKSKKYLKTIGRA